jgi:hypothetical protein
MPLGGGSSVRTFNRRTLVAGSTGAIGGFVGLLYPGVGRALGLGTEQMETGRAVREGATAITITGPDPGFASGYVVEKTASGVILNSDFGSRAVRIKPGSLAWREYLQPADSVIELQDWMDVRGTPLDDGSLEARDEWMWLNIGRIEGPVHHFGPGSIFVENDKGIQELELSSRLEVVNGEDESPREGGASSLAAGMLVGAVGLRLPDNGFRATRIWTHKAA